ncbi:MAG: LysR family transcriptional regulator, partial [Pseudomonadota bacterium]
ITQLRAFVAVSQSGGFAPAADALDVAPSSVTRAIANLEAFLGVRLFQRTTRSVSLTEAGERFFSQIAPALDELDAAADGVIKGGENLSGNLKVSASVSFGQIVIAPNVSRFVDEYPNLKIDLHLSDQQTDLISNRIDVAIRHGELENSSLIAQRLAPVRYHLVASPHYLRKAAAITHPKDLKNHSCLTYPCPAFRSRWRFKSGRKHCEVDVSPTLRVTNAAALAGCVKSGMGVALLADWMVDGDLSNGSLVNILPEWTASGIGSDVNSSLWIVTPSRAFVPAKTKAFSEFLRSIVLF